MGHGPCLAKDCPIAGQGPLAGYLRPCPGAPGPQHPGERRDILREELEHLWSDLDQSIKRRRDFVAMGGRGDAETWSVETEGLVERIGVISRAVGPISPGDVQVPLLLDGTFDRVHRATGLEPPEFDRDEMQAWWDNYLTGQHL